MTDAPASERQFRITRRKMILGGTLAGGALVVGYTATHPMEAAGALLSGGGPEPEESAFGSFIRISPDGWVTVVNKQQELGQGVHAGMAAMIAEELDADWNRVRVVSARANFRAYGPQLTAGSRSIASNWDPMRNAGAGARAMFVAAAAMRWSVPRRFIDVRDGVVSHAPSGRSATFADLLADAARQSPPRTPVLKDAKDYRLIGTGRVRRKDSVAKSTGAQVYTQDVQLPNMLVAMVAHSPRFGGRLARFDAAAARKVKGVVDVFAIETGVAVVAKNTFAARQGRDALILEWDDSDAEKRSSSDLVRYFHDIAAGHTDVKPSDFHSKGQDAEAPFSADAIDFSFNFPYLAHAPMETLDCVAQVDGWNVKVISGSHLATVDQVQAARAALTIPGRVDVEVLPAGGSFGRRGIMGADYLVECVRIAKRMPRRPVKLIWSREDEMSSGFFRPMSHHRVLVELDARGFPARWRHRTVSQPLLPLGPNAQAVEGVAESPYLATAKVIDGKIFSPTFPVPVAFWRSVGHSHNGMVMEHIIDQLASRIGRDPAAYRRALYRRARAKRHLAVLDELCRRAGWGTVMESGWARGLAIHECFGTVVGQIAEVRIAQGRPVVRRVVAVVDCGTAISPDQITAQMEGGIGFGLSATLYGAMTIKDGIVQETNFDRYPVIRMNEMPTIETYILPSTNRPTGMGEPGVPPIAPAIANAVFALTGAPTMSLPILRDATSANAGFSIERAST